MGLISRVSSRTYRSKQLLLTQLTVGNWFDWEMDHFQFPDPDVKDGGDGDTGGDDPGGGSGSRRPDKSKNQSNVKFGSGTRTGWLNTMENLIDIGILTWDESGLILMTPEDDSVLIDALKSLESQWKNPLVNFKKNMSNYLFKMLRDRGRLAYTNPYYNREFRYDDEKMEVYIKKVKEKKKTENSKKKKKKKKKK